MKKTMEKSFNFQGGRLARLAWTILFALALSLQFAQAGAAPLKLRSIDFSTLPGDNLQVRLVLSGPAFSPRIFHTDNPARIAMDLPGVGSEVDKKPIPINVGGAESVQAMEAAGRTRVVLNLVSMTPYSSKVEGDTIYLVLQKGRAGLLANPAVYAPPSSRGGAAANAIRNVDFRRGENGVGRLLITLGNPKTIVDLREEGRKIIAVFPNTTLPQTLARRLDVMDFATPVQSIESYQEDGDAKMVITPATDEYDYSSYQTENLLTVEFRPLTRVEKDEIKKRAFAYSGEKLSLNFQDIEVRSVLQILADFTNLNIVASDTVQGRVTLRLNDVPWDQALDLVLKSKGLGKRQEGNIIRVLPLAELNAIEKSELEAQKTVEELEPLRTEIIQVNYTKAEDIKAVLYGTRLATSETSVTVNPIGNARTRENTSTESATDRILSARGNVTVDARTNQLIVQDTPRSLERIRDLVQRLDIPVRQVLIESRVVIATNDFTRELGSRLSVNRNRRGIAVTDANGADLTQQTFKGNTYTNADLLVDLASAAAAGSGGSFGLTLLKVGDYLLDLELSAAQIEGRSEVVSNPRLITSDQTKAVILQGEEIPYQATLNTGGGTAVAISYKQAVLQLEVTPHITPDNNVLMELLVKKDARGTPAPAGLAIDKREIRTTAQVGNGETVVLGGIYEGTKINNTDKVPLLGDLPGIGFMFRRNHVEDKKKELLIFITPKILQQNLGSR
jgi:type IV pilus assembly protein PilQ